MVSKFKKRRRLFIGIIIAIVVVILLFVFLQGDSAPTYEFTTASRRNVVQEVSVSGNVHPEDRIELAFERTGTVSSLPVEVGQYVEAGTLLAQLNAQEAQKNVRTAQVELEAAQINLEKLRLEYEQLLRGDELNESSEDALATLANLYNEYEDILEDLDTILLGSTLEPPKTNIEYYANAIGEPSISLRVQSLYQGAETMYQKSLLDYQAAQRGGGQERQKAVQSGYELVVQTADLIKTGRDAIRSFEDKVLQGNAVHTYQSTINSHISDLTAHSASINTYVTDLLADITAINGEQDEEQNYPLTIASQQLTVRQKQIALEDAQDNLEKYSIRAPLAGVLAKRDIRIGETATVNAPALTLISENTFEVEANVPEADISKVEVGDAALLTLDAYGRDEPFAAIVTKVDPAEIIIDGVPTYKITLRFLEEDGRIRSGMTANIRISSDRKDNVIAIPSRAVIREDGKKYVRIVRNESIERVEVETGLQGSDGTVEIISGIQEGDRVIVFLPE